MVIFMQKYTIEQAYTSFRKLIGMKNTSVIKYLGFILSGCYHHLFRRAFGLPLRYMEYCRKKEGK